MLVFFFTGTGKSYVINAILQQAKQKYNDQQVVQIVSPTGAASKQFTGGKTIHAYLKILVSKSQGKEKSFEELGEAKAQQLERDLAHLRLLIIDEKGKRCTFVKTTILFPPCRHDWVHPSLPD